MSNKVLYTVLVLFFMSIGAYAQNFAVSTNFVDYADLGTLNMEASLGVARRWTVHAGVKYNPFTWGEGNKAMTDRQRSFDAGARFWPWHIYSGWWMGGKLRYQEYNRGGIISQASTEGDRFGGGLSAGYTFMLADHLNLDLGLGVWSGYDKWIEYECVRCGRTSGQGENFFVRPGDILVSLSYIF